MCTSLFLVENNFLLRFHKITQDTNQIHRSLFSEVTGKCVIIITTLPFLYFLVVLLWHLQRTWDRLMKALIHLMQELTRSWLLIENMEFSAFWLKRVKNLLVFYSSWMLQAWSHEIKGEWHLTCGRHIKRHQLIPTDKLCLRDVKPWVKFLKFREK